MEKRSGKNSARVVSIDFIMAVPLNHCSAVLPVFSPGVTLLIQHELLHEERILIVTPQGSLAKKDFELLCEVVDPFIAQEGNLQSLMIYTESFPGWNSFAALVSHLKFVKDHHKHIAKVAAVTDSSFLSITPHIADHFMKAQIKHFRYDDKQNALAWLSHQDA